MCANSMPNFIGWIAEISIYLRRNAEKRVFFYHPIFYIIRQILINEDALNSRNCSAFCAWNWFWFIVRPKNTSNLGGGNNPSLPPSLSVEQRSSKKPTNLMNISTESEGTLNNSANCALKLASFSFHWLSWWLYSIACASKLMISMRPIDQSLNDILCVSWQTFAIRMLLGGGGEGGGGAGS